MFDRNSKINWAPHSKKKGKPSTYHNLPHPIHRHSPCPHHRRTMGWYIGGQGIETVWVGTSLKLLMTYKHKAKFRSRTYLSSMCSDQPQRQSQHSKRTQDEDLEWGDSRTEAILEKRRHWPWTHQVSSLLLHLLSLWLYQVWATRSTHHMPSSNSHAGCPIHPTKWKTQVPRNLKGPSSSTRKMNRLVLQPIQEFSWRTPVIFKKKSGRWRPMSLFCIRWRKKNDYKVLYKLCEFFIKGFKKYVCVVCVCISAWSYARVKKHTYACVHVHICVYSCMWYALRVILLSPLNWLKQSLWPPSQQRLQMCAPPHPAKAVSLFCFVL